MSQRDVHFIYHVLPSTLICQRTPFLYDCIYHKNEHFKISPIKKNRVISLEFA